MNPRWWVLLAGASLLGGCSAARGASTSDPAFRLEVSPAVIQLPGSIELTYRLVMVTGDEAERFTVDLHPPAFRVRAGTPTGVREEGATITPAGPAQLEGPGTLTPVGEGIALIACSPNGSAAHGYEPHVPGFRVELPPNSTSTLIARYRTGDITLWPRPDMRLRAVISPRTGGHGAQTLARGSRVHSPNVTARGPKGTRIELVTRPGSSITLLKRVRRVPVGQPLLIFGRVTPRPAGRRITLRYRGPDGRLRLVGRARTDASGRFRWRRWAPRRRGIYEISATVPGGPGVLRDYSCPVAFRAR